MIFLSFFARLSKNLSVRKEGRKERWKERRKREIRKREKEREIKSPQDCHFLVSVGCHYGLLFKANTFFSLQLGRVFRHFLTVSA